MGAWGEGPFENDTSMDWVHELRESEDPDYPLGVLRELDGLGPLDTQVAELGIAAAEAVAASRGRPAEEVPADVLEWLRASGARADAAVAELALRVVDAIEADSELCAVWDEAGGSRWHAEIADLRCRLRTGRILIPPPRS